MVCVYSAYCSSLSDGRAASELRAGSRLTFQIGERRFLRRKKKAAEASTSFDELQSVLSRNPGRHAGGLFYISLAADFL